MDKERKKCGFINAILGKNSEFIDFDSLERPINKKVVPAIQALKFRARSKGFDLRIASGYRSFDQQLCIWNEKALGKRVTLDVNEIPIDMKELSEDARVFAILRWSALPGASRHHWGSDFDIFDANAIPENYKLRLNVEETEKAGIFAEFYGWVQKVLDDKSELFFRPYDKNLGGVAREPWHLSYRPIAQKFEKELSLAILENCIRESDIELKQTILKNIEEIYHRFVVNVER